MTKEEISYRRYLQCSGYAPQPISTALIDMDGVLYNSMYNHSRAWKRLGDEQGWHYEDNEFFLYEGMTGAAIIRLMEKREHGRDDVSDEECKRLYALKAAYFTAQGEVEQMPGTARMLATLRESEITRVLVTGSGQASLLDRLNRDYPGTFFAPLRVTAHDVTHGKPNPEPYLMGLHKASSEPSQSIVIENAPLGVEAGHRSGCFTIGITTGPMAESVLTEHGADIVYPTMDDFADALPNIIELRKSFKL